MSADVLLYVDSMTDLLVTTQLAHDVLEILPGELSNLAEGVPAALVSVEQKLGLAGGLHQLPGIIPLVKVHEDGLFGFPVGGWCQVQEAPQEAVDLEDATDA